MANQNPIRIKIPNLGLILLTVILVLAACGSVSNSPTNSSPATTNDMAQPIQTPSLPSTTPQTTGEESSFPTRIPTPASKPFTTTGTLATISNGEAPPVCKPDELCFETIPITATTQATTTVPVTTTTAQTTSTIQPIGSEILFLREGILTAYDNQRQQERQLASQVRSFAATPDGRLLALVRVIDDSNQATDVWLVQRDGSGLRQLTRDARNEHNLSWSPDGMTLIYDSSPAAIPVPPEWQTWAGWCSASEVRMLDILSGTVTTLAPGCDAAFSLDGLRIAFATPPQQQEAIGQTNNPTNIVVNTIQLVNRQGKNGWAFATAKGAATETGRLVYAPAWSADSANLIYHRFIGYQMLVDINYTELANSYEGNGKLAASGAGWLRPAIAAPDGRHLALIGYDPVNARGVRGYEMWQLQVVATGKTGTIYLPEGEVATVANSVDTLNRVTNAAWSPTGVGEAPELVVALPANWQPGAAEMEPLFEQTTNATLWLWQPGQPPSEPLVQNVAYASPLAWLPAPPSYEMTPQGYQVAYPSEWLPLLNKTAVTSYQSPDGKRHLHTTLLPNNTGNGEDIRVEAVFGEYIGTVEQENEAQRLPDGSFYHTIVGTSPDGTAIIGAMRVGQARLGEQNGQSWQDAPKKQGEQTQTIALFYTTPAQQWGLERAWVQALLAASGPQDIDD